MHIDDLAAYLNTLLREAGTLPELAALEGKRFALTLEPVAQTWGLVVRDGVWMNEDAADLADVRLKGDALGFLHLIRGRGAPGRLYIEGDVHAASHLQKLLGQLQPDFWQLLQGVLAQLGAEGGRRMGTGLRRLATPGAPLAHALLEHLAQDAVSLAEVEAQNARLELLMQRVEVLAREIATREVAQ